MKPRPKLAGIWMVSKAREDGLNGKVTGKMCLASMSNWGESFLSRSRTCKDKKVMTSVFSHLADNNHVTKMICAYRHTCVCKHSLYAKLSQHIYNNCAIKLQLLWLAPVLHISPSQCNLEILRFPAKGRLCPVSGNHLFSKWNYSSVSVLPSPSPLSCDTVIHILTDQKARACFFYSALLAASLWSFQNFSFSPMYTKIAGANEELWYGYKPQFSKHRTSHADTGLSKFAYTNLTAWEVVIQASLHTQRCVILTWKPHT